MAFGKFFAPKERLLWVRKQVVDSVSCSHAMAVKINLGDAETLVSVAEGDG